jgi:predicted MFS family arabinose efflux permease
LLALSSLLHAWGNAGTYTLVADLLPEQHQVAGNALVSTIAQAAIVIGPALAGAATTLVGPGWVIGADAASFAVLAATCWPAAGRPAHALTGDTHTGAPADSRTAEGAAATTGAARTSGSRTILGQPRLLALLAITCAFFFLYGPVEVALPIHIAKDLHAPPGLLGAYWTAFGVGAVLGGLGAGLLRHLPPPAVVVGIILGWGAALLPLGLSDAVWPGLTGFAVGGLIYGPFTAICTTLYQRTSPPHALSRVLATRTALTTPSTAFGTLLGGPAVAAFGARHALLASALLTITLGAAVAAIARLARSRRRVAAAPRGVRRSVAGRRRSPAGGHLQGGARGRGGTRHVAG